MMLWHTPPLVFHEVRALASYGGILKDTYGKFIFVVYHKLEECLVLEAWAVEIYQGISLVGEGIQKFDNQIEKC